MKSVMLSIRPQWCELIANGQKTIEVRKTRPKLDAPFKCYIYCTSIKTLNLQEYCGIHQRTSGMVDDWSGKVIGEFVCDYIQTLFWDSDIRYGEDFPNGYIDNICKTARLTLQEVKDYATSKDAYCWHISALQIYDKPRELGEYFLACDKPKGTDCSQCIDKRLNRCKSITRPPQSWCYVEEAMEGKK